MLEERGQPLLRSQLAGCLDEFRACVLSEFRSHGGTVARDPRVVNAKLILVDQYRLTLFSPRLFIRLRQQIEVLGRGSRIIDPFAQ